MIKHGSGDGTGSGGPSCDSEPLSSAFIRGYTAKHGQTNPRALDAEMITRLPSPQLKIITIYS
jgi:hypothetical protein